MRFVGLGEWLLGARANVARRLYEAKP